MARAARVLLMAALCACLCAWPAAALQSADDDTPAARAWSRIAALDQAPSGADYAAARKRREAILREIAAYQSLYPGGAQRDAAIRLELRTRYELACLAGGDWEPFCKRIEDLLAGPPSRDAACEAAYWRLRCLDARREPPATRPSSLLVTESTKRQLDNYETYVLEYPDSRHAAHLATVVFEAARRREDWALCQRMVEHLQRQTPARPVTRRLAARLTLFQHRGRSVSWTLPDCDGTTIDLATLRGRPVWIVIWSSAAPDARTLVDAINANRAAAVAPLVIGIDIEPGRGESAAWSRRLAPSWRHACEPLGLAAGFAADRGIQVPPTVLAINDNGVLSDIVEGAAVWDWLGAEHRLIDKPQPDR